MDPGDTLFRSYIQRKKSLTVHVLVISMMMTSSNLYVRDRRERETGLNHFHYCMYVDRDVM